MLSYLYNHRSALVLALTALTALAGCDECQEEWYFNSFRLNIENASTGEPVCDAVVSATQGNEVQEITRNGCEYVGPVEQEGRFSITITHPDFETAALELDVDRDGCHVLTETRDLALTPVGSAN